MLNIIFIVVGLYAAFTGGMYVFQRNLMYYPSTEIPDRSQAGVPDMHDVTLKTEDGLSLLAWYKEASTGQPTIVLFHGNAGHIGYRGYKARMFMDAGFGVLLVEYRGYGGNPGKPSEQGFLADGRAALAFLGQSGVGSHSIVLYGESLGSGVAVQLASDPKNHDSIKAMVLEAPFTSMADVAAHHYPLVPARKLVKDKFDSLSRIGRYSGALLVIHGENDRIVPTSFGRKLFSAAREPKEAHWIPGVGHNDLFQPKTGKLVIDYLRRLIPKGLSSSGG